MRASRWVSLVAIALIVPACGDGSDPFVPPPDPDPVPRLHQLYTFRSPVNANNTVFVLTVNPRAGLDHPTTFSRGQTVRLHVDLDSDIVADLTLEAVFGAADATGAQSVTLFANGAPIAQGVTGQNLAVSGGGFTSGQFRAALADDPAFIDRIGLNQLEAGGAFPRSPASNFYGPTANCLAMVLELPSAEIAAINTIINVWVTTVADGTQIARLGRPLTISLMIPPLPTGSFPDDRAAFMAHPTPANDDVIFGTDVRGALVTHYSRTLADSNALANIFLPDVLRFQIGNPNGYGTFIASGGPTQFGNGRRLRDDVTDILVNILTNGAKTTDNVPDDNGMKITDGNMGTVAAFPYVGAAN